MNLINKAQCKKLALEFSKEYRSGKFQRVSEKFLKDLNSVVWNKINVAVRHHPTKGKTLMEIDI